MLMFTSGASVVGVVSLLGYKKHDYVKLSTDPTAVVLSDKHYMTDWNKVFSFTDCVKLCTQC